MKKTLSKGIFSQAMVFLGATLLVSGGATAAIEIDQQPLLVAKPVPGNMAIIGSFEFPTMVTRAYKGDYSSSSKYIGYFDNGKCYKYNDDASNEKNRHFYPVRTTTTRLCSGGKEWSGNFMNWATMQSIDIFRHILTGGHRFKDEEGETWLEKGVQTSQGGSDNNFPDGNISGWDTVKNATPATWGSFSTRIGQSNYAMGNTMKFTRDNSFIGSTTPIIYDPDKFGLSNILSTSVLEVSIRVKVCVSGMLEENCQKYPNGKYKPTGLIQEYSDTMRYSAFGYLNDNSNGTNNKNRSGGVMHARMKYVGPNRVSISNTQEENSNNEWDPQTGVFILNPDPVDASNTDFGNTAVTHSGVISYINRSGHLIPGTLFKRYDNVSDLFYTAYRYMKGLPNIATYTDTSDKAGDAKDKLIGGLPVIKDWKNTVDDPENPIQWYCQKNFFLGIGDTNTHNDTGFLADGINQADPAANDPLLLDGNFAALRKNMHDREKLESYTVDVSGSYKSDHIAVLAYDANTADLRTDMPGKQTASTYWIDILESGLRSRQNNHYWLAAKYGGFKVPDTFDRTKAEIINEASWWTSGEKLSNNNKRPDNFYVVDKAEDMVNSLVRAFADIGLEQRGNRASLALNSTKLEAGAMTFQAQYISGAWTGNMSGYEIDATTGAINPTAKWNAESELPDWDDREIYVNASDTAELAEFSEVGKNLTGFNKDKANYLLGKREKETDGTFRIRQGLIGDIVSSQPVFVGKPRADLFSTRSFPGQDTYSAWAKGISRDSIVYVGANDGMLHGFNADDGEEVFAFIPKTVIANGLSDIVNKDYDHRYFIDGEITVADVYINSKWKTILVGTLGAGGINQARNTTNNAVFALDITDPDSVKFLWEKSSVDIPELGINLGKPVIIQDEAKNWKVVLGNGPNSNGVNGDKAHLINVDIKSGSHTVLKLSDLTANGLSAVRAWDSDGNGLTDTLYAGDLQGVVWKITGLSVTPTATALFNAKDPTGVAQPITATPMVGKSPYDKTTWIFFGTGQYLSTLDLVGANAKQVQSWYGIKDNGTNNKARNVLLERKILKEVSVTTDDGSRTARIIEEGTREDLVGKEGWYIDLYRMTNGTGVAAGERMITQNQFQGSALIGNTRIPDASDPCAPSGLGMIMSINPFTGARLSDNYFDINADGTINNADLIMIDGVPTVVSGIGFDTGFSNPSFLGKKMYVPFDDGSIREIDIQQYSSMVGRTSWRELINTGD